MVTFALLVIVMIANFLLLTSKLPQRIGVATWLNTMMLVVLLGSMFAQWGASREWTFYIPLMVYNVLPMYVVIFLFSVFKPVPPKKKAQPYYGKKM